MARYVRPQNFVDLLARLFGRLSDGLRRAGTTREADRAREIAEPRVMNASIRWLPERARGMEHPRAQAAAPADIGFDRSAGERRLARVMRERAYAVDQFLARQTHEEEIRERSRALLLRMLTPAQRVQFERENRFTVRVKGRGRFIVTSGAIFNVAGPDSTTYCTRAEPPVPIYDLMLAQKILLEADPSQFFKVANRDRP